MSADPRLLADRYRLLTVVAKGGMGQVWEGRDELLGRTVAIKEVRFPTDVPDEERALLGERTLREARLTARLTHRGIVTIYDVILVDERPYIVMELFRAPSLATQIDEHGPLPPRDVAGIGLQLLDALAAAHREGILHRDVKPSNVLLADDRILLTDFGIATSESDSTLTSTGLLIGSPTYMSPERLRGEGIGPPADLWSLGATLYAALEAEPPFRATSTMGTITAVLVDEPRSPSVTGPLRDAILGMLDKDVQTRLTIPEAAALLRRSIEQPSGAVAPAIPGDGSETPLPHSPPVMAPVVTWEHPVHIKPTETPRPPSDGLSILEPVASFSSVAATPQGDGPPSDAAHFDDEEPPGWPDDDESAQRRRRFALLAATALVAIALLALVVWTQLNEPDTTAGPGLTNGTEQTTKSEPTKSEPTKSKPTKSEPTKSEPTKSEPTRGSGGNNAGPVVVPPAETLTTFSPTTSAPTTTAPTTTAPTTTAHDDSAHDDCADQDCADQDCADQDCADDDSAAAGRCGPGRLPPGTGPAGFPGGGTERLVPAARRGDPRRLRQSGEFGKLPADRPESGGRPQRARRLARLRAFPEWHLQRV